MRRLLVATTNKAKFEEYKIILEGFGIKAEIVSLEDVGVVEKAKESKRTFKGNAEQKARFYCNLSGLPTLSDDGGLEIDCLKKKPGVYSHRPAGYVMGDEEIIETVLEMMQGVPMEERRARLRVAVSLAFPKNREVIISEDTLEGFLAESPIALSPKGYPYRSIFLLLNGQCFAELSQQEMARISHRRKAIKKFLPLLRKIFKE